MTTTYAIIGTGVVGERIINQVLQHERSEITAIYDENSERLSQMAQKYNVPAVASLDELFATKPDWVYIGTPPVSHATLTEQAAALGFNILCEKPLAHDVADGEAMVAAAKNVTTAMHFPMMYSPAVHRLHDAVKSQELGDIVRIELHTHFPVWPRPWQQNPWIASREQGGFIREIFPHYLQLTHHIFGDVTIAAHETNYPADVTLCETSVSALLKTASGIPMLINGAAGIAQQERIDYKVYGTKKSMIIRNWSDLIEVTAETGEEVLTVEPAKLTLLDACEQQQHIVHFEEGLKVQSWIDELLK